MFPWTRSTSLGVLIVPLHKHICQHGPLYSSATLFHIHYPAYPDHKVLRVCVCIYVHTLPNQIYCLWLKGEWDQRAGLTSCISETCGVCAVTSLWLQWRYCCVFPCPLHYWGGWDIAGFSWCGSCWLRLSGNPIPVCSVARGQLQ